MEKINTNDAPKAIGPYSQAVIANGFLYTSGQIAINPKTSEMVENNIEAQAKQVFTNIGAILNAANIDFNNVVKTTVFIKNMADFGIVNKIYEEYFVSKPARSCVEVSSLPKNALIEVEVIAKI